eukprot:1537529-Pleurochrysis_carterae.AAC.1
MSASWRSQNAGPNCRVTRCTPRTHGPPTTAKTERRQRTSTSLPEASPTIIRTTANAASALPSAKQFGRPSLVCRRPTKRASFLSSMYGPTLRSAI